MIIGELPITAISIVVKYLLRKVHLLCSKSFWLVLKNPQDIKSSFAERLRKVHNSIGTLLDPYRISCRLYASTQRKVLQLMNFIISFLHIHLFIPLKLPIYLSLFLGIGLNSTK